MAEDERRIGGGLEDWRVGRRLEEEWKRIGGGCVARFSSNFDRVGMIGGGLAEDERRIGGGLEEDWKTGGLEEV